MTSKIRVLIVDDSAFNRRAMRLMMAHPTVDVIAEASNGREAVEFVANQDDLDLVLMDVRMPVMDGLQAAQHIKQIRPAVKVLLTSSFAGYEDDARAAGADAFLSKNDRFITVCQTSLELFDDILSSEFAGALKAGIA